MKRANGEDRNENNATKRNSSIHQNKRKEKRKTMENIQFKDKKWNEKNKIWVELKEI